MRGQASVFLVVLVVMVLAAAGLVMILNYNGIVKAEKTVEEAEAQIGTVCQRRLDLIPNLIETVKAYAQHEQTTLLAVTQARTKAEQALGSIGKPGSLSKEDIAQIEATQSELSGAFRGVLAVVENYPNLRASTNFLALQDQFEGTENRIAVARQRYNTAVRNFNSKIETFPGVFIAPTFGFEEKDYFEAKPEAYEPVKAKF